MVVEIKRLTDTAVLPERGSGFAAGYDLYADIKDDIIIEPHQTVLVSTGLSMAIPPGYFGGVFARSGLAAKEGLRPANCVGVVDSDYRGEIMAALHNDSEISRIVKPKERIAQLVILPFLEAEFIEKEELKKTERGEGGFGSTGK